MTLFKFEFKLYDELILILSKMMIHIIKNEIKLFSLGIYKRVKP